MAMQAPSSAASPEAGVVTAGLDLVSGVFSYLAGQSAASVARSRADLIRTEAQANAQRYAEQAAQKQAQTSVMYLASGVKLTGSPVDALATAANITSQNISAILAEGDTKAMDEETLGVNAENKGRDALLSGIDKGAGAVIKSTGMANMGFLADAFSKAGGQ